MARRRKQDQGLNIEYPAEFQVNSAQRKRSATGGSNLSGPAMRSKFVAQFAQSTETRGGNDKMIMRFAG